MTIRSRPVLDRKHRPRWQDELRTQQLTILGFALAIALALGIFGAATWNSYWESHLRPVAVVAEESFDRSDLSEREAILTAEVLATVTELQAQLDGGPRDQLIQQQIDSLSSTFNQVSTLAAESLVDGAVLAEQAADFGVSVSDQEVAAEVEERLRLAERVRAQLIRVDPLAPDEPEASPSPGATATPDASPSPDATPTPDASPTPGATESADATESPEPTASADAEPTEEQLAAARAEAAEARRRIEEGEGFADVAADVSDDFTGTGGGLIGWFDAEDPDYGVYVEPLADAEVGNLVGPIETEDGFVLLELLDRRQASDSGPLSDLLDQNGVSDAAYREYVRSELLIEAYRSHFTDEVVGEEAPQRRVARIGITPPEGEPVPQERARHVLIQPLPDADDQAEATEEEWEAAREEAEEVREELTQPDADWYEIAPERSADTGSASRGGDLGWFDPEASPFVAEFADALAELEVGEVSQPVRTEFGWHVIQKTGERESPQQEAEELVATLRDDPDAFAETARRLSDDAGTAAEGGEVGWIAPYQLEPMHERVVFELTDVGEISDPVEDEDGTITIYQLLESSESRELDDAQVSAVSSSGFERWLDEAVRAPVETWVDPQFDSAGGT